MADELLERGRLLELFYHTVQRLGPLLVVGLNIERLVSVNPPKDDTINIYYYHCLGDFVMFTSKSAKGSYLVVRHHGPLGTTGVDGRGSHQARQDGVVDDHLVVEGPKESLRVTFTQTRVPILIL